MKRFSLKRLFVAAVMTLFVASQATWVLAGTTGGLSGQITDDNGAAVAAAEVKITSASQTAQASTDATGHFTFLSLAPDTYTVAIEKQGYNPVSYAGVTVFADNQLSLSFKLTKALKEIAKVSARASGSLVKASTTADVYSVNASNAGKLNALGGGGGLDNAYSAIASVPGAYVPVGQVGWFQTVIIRGGGFDQVGYEVDGVPVNRSFDNYPSSTASALGQQEVQVYTGASPANAEGQGLSGFINQVIRTGTYPGFASSDLAVGAPIFYHKANVEVGGASPDRLFSYYAGFGGYNTDSRFYDQKNGAGISAIWGLPVDFAASPTNCTGLNTDPNVNNFDTCYQNGAGSGPGGVVLGPANYTLPTNLSDRESVLNFHFGIPHRRDGGRDDLQLLYQSSDLHTTFYNAPNDISPDVYANDPALGTPVFPKGYSYNGQIGQPLPTTIAAGTVSKYFYPSQPVNGFGGPIPGALRDGNDNGLGIVKLQYQKNFGSDAYLRIYGYSLYSNWFLYGPNTNWANFVGPNPEDYELETHTRGLSATFAKQLNPHNLLQLQASYTTATSLRDNNTQAGNGSQVLGLVVDSNNPLSGICYNVSGATPAATACQHANQGGSPTTLTIKNAYLASIGVPGKQPANVSGMTCGTGACEWLAVENGQKATFNAVTPKFSAVSLTDEWDPTDRLHLNLGLRFDQYQYDPGNTAGAARSLFFNSWNQSMCYDPADGIFTPASKLSVAGGTQGGSCTVLGPNYVPATISNTNAVSTRRVFEPRIGATLTVNPLNVIRFSYGKYSQAPNAAFYQYNTLQQDLADFIGPRMFAYGRTQPTYDFPAQISYNGDLSWEHQFRGTDMSFKLTPFYRKTNDQVQQFPLDPKTGFVSGLNVGAQTNQGVELQLQKGDFSRNGFAALFSYTYTHARIRYSKLSTGGSVLDTTNTGIAQYNAYTQACGNGGSLVGVKQYGQYVCGGPAASTTAAPCYNAGAPVTNAALCTATSGFVANPYYNAPTQSLFDPTAQYAPYATFVGNIGVGSYSGFVAPNVLTLVMNYKHDRLAVTPSVQFSSGVPYGYPLASQGVDPTSCGALTGGPDTARYPFGGAGQGYDAVSCTNVINIPNPDTGKFDNIGAFNSPNRFTGNLQLSYELSSHVTAVATLANLFDVCSGGTGGSWTSVPGVPKRTVCGWTAGGVPTSGLNPVGNVYNPGAIIQPVVAHSYIPTFGSNPFNAYVDLKIKL